MSHHARRERGAQIDERGREGEQGGDDEAHGIRNLEPRIRVREEDSGGPERVQLKEPARRQESERDQQDAGVAPAVRRAPAA